ncbi:hypothetical protein DFH08DRAFT_834846 [Mycena albidolilacea]|uniref:CYTH domain-containing protein n=1 Tax=Mycena albidolilacea TaxID=1033008 RepID=A0AAD7F5E5_9AGAR|nr:hypothetical protein DFH08DRAFT_834846 [Mycena albidolilacea]
MARRFLSTLASHIEIERKFLPTRALLNALTRSTSTPRLPPLIARVHPAPEHFIQDVYYDRADGRLVSEGVWVRRRSVFVPGDSPTSISSSTSSWEAKVRVGGDFAASQFVEVQGAEAVEREILRALGGRTRVVLDKIDEHLAVMCDLTTRRLESRLELSSSASTEFADDENDAGLKNLTVVIDQAIETPRADFAVARSLLERMSAFDELDVASSPTPSPSRAPFFSHEIGELEIMQEVRTEGDTEEQTTQKHEWRRKTVAGRRAFQLEAFMREHPALFPMEPKPRGKLEAYFTWVEERDKARIA